MMIQISSDEWVNSDEICHIKRVDDMTCLISMDSGIYTALMPVQTILAMLKQEPTEGKEISILQEMNKKIGDLPVFAG